MKPERVTITGNGTLGWTTEPWVMTTQYGRYWHDIDCSTCPILSRSQPYNNWRERRDIAEKQGKRPCPECGPLR